MEWKWRENTVMKGFHDYPACLIQQVSTLLRKNSERSGEAVNAGGKTRDTYLVFTGHRYLVLFDAFHTTEGERAARTKRSARNERWITSRPHCRLPLCCNAQQPTSGESLPYTHIYNTLSSNIGQRNVCNRPSSASSLYLFLSNDDLSNAL